MKIEVHDGGEPINAFLWVRFGEVALISWYDKTPPQGVHAGDNYDVVEWSDVIFGE